MKEENQYEVPFQVLTLIATLKDNKERVHIRGNYRNRLDGIRRVIDKAINDYDVEMGNTQSLKFKKGQR
jgi:hypothetical protein